MKAVDPTPSVNAKVRLQRLVLFKPEVSVNQLTGSQDAKPLRASTK